VVKAINAFGMQHAVIAAALVAGIFTAVTTATPGAGNNIVVSAASATPVQSATKSCDGTWPYLNCGQSNDQSVRVIRIN